VPLTAWWSRSLRSSSFGGALQGAVRKTHGGRLRHGHRGPPLAAVHFLKQSHPHGPGRNPLVDRPLAVARYTLALPPAGLLLGGFTTLLLAGLILGYVRDRTRSLWMPIGLHAGWIIGEKGLMAITRRSEAWPWLGPDIPNTLVGLAPLLTLLVTWAIVWLMLRDIPE